MFAELLLDFGADLKVAPPQIPSQVQKNVTNGQTVGISGTLRISNGGPSTQLDGDLYVNLNGPGTSAVTVQGASSKAFPDCETELNVGLHCKLSELRGGRTAELPSSAR